MDAEGIPNHARIAHERKIRLQRERRAERQLVVRKPPKPSGRVPVDSAGKKWNDDEKKMKMWLNASKNPTTDR